VPKPPVTDDNDDVIRVMGLLYGQQDGRTVKVLETVEMGYKEKDGQITILQTALENDMKLFSASYPTYECLGWYSTGKKITQLHQTIHKLISKYNERPLLLLFNPFVELGSGLSGSSGSDLPISLFEQTVHVAHDKVTIDFVQTKYYVAADEAERITVVHCAKSVSQSQSGSSLTPHLSTLHKAISSLNQRTKLIHQFLTDVKNGVIVADQSLLREIKGLCNRLPTIDSAQFKQDFTQEYNDALLVTYLSCMTQGSSIMTDVIDKFNVAYQPQPKRGGGGGHQMGGGVGFSSYGMSHYDHF